MRNLKSLLYGVSIKEVVGNTEVFVENVVFDSRKIKNNDVFVAQKGVSVDGHTFIDKAIDLGAIAIICEELPTEKIKHISYVKVADANRALAIIASNFYDNPSNKLSLVGVTGTNGKTTVATLLYQLFKKAGYKVGLLSTVQVMIDDEVFGATHTTPDSLSINFYLDKMLTAGVEYCFMEVSSHGIHQQRTAGLLFSGGVFTNLSHDHLDYHATFAEYRNVKKLFFDTLSKKAFVLTNLDDKNGSFMLQNTQAIKKTYALKTGADYKAKILEKQVSGTLISVDGIEIWTHLIGVFNIYNLIAVIATADLLGVNKLLILKYVSELKSVSGRFENVVSDTDITAIVDYAHTPDALKNVLETINNIKNKNQNVITVVGCGGDRDKTKRPKMAHIASHLSTQVILTSDNPRTENPQTILNDMEAGVLPENVSKTITIQDRRQAIKAACKFAVSGDILLIAGKGHENYQEVNGVRSHFDDLEEVKNCFKQLKK
ncbi:UDP-N-acetylmuramoyl-L-alanyl-D-glutamate--2,6-diaminopimelate ligase [Polaribacter tangerinus]|uniref:UDP-N-acetylmuramoyl-L-alanyl-D-glutamate--2, 6-diaminopimelate ligase n=1 Tax=Polaribacter tangerinus TaxID=1920034 RepID=UPI000B4AC420|nr:UDP-N-acetylmuramoyl-L-alanyl-D-glutamate--2,6-diaminopimelate ligase [Polaribacter tangerinus]